MTRCRQFPTSAALLLAVLVFVASAAGYARPIHRVLPNGAQIVVEENHTSPVAAIRFYVGVGSLFEGEYMGAGISHLVEHCCGKGTPTHTAAQIDELEAAIGGHANAYTTRDHTCYYITTLGAWAGQAVDLLGDYVLGAIFPEEEVAQQIDVVTREIARVDDSPGRAIGELFNQTMFRRSPERYRVIGYLAEFNKLTREDLVKFHREHYTPDNLVVVAVGDFDADEIADKLEQVLGSYPLRGQPPALLPQEAGPTTVRRAERQWPGLRRARLVIGWRTIDLFHPDLYALDVLAYVLGHGDSARLPRLLRDEMGLVDNVATWSHTPAYGAGTFAISASLDPVNIPQVEQQALTEVAKVCRELVTDEELQRAKRQKEAVLVYAQETPQGRAEVLGTDLLLAGDLGFSDEYVAGIRGVTAAQVQEVARKYLVPDRYVITSLLPAQAKQETAADQPETVPLPQTEKYTLDNGLTVLIRAEPGAPSVHIVTATRAGLRYENEQNNGITRLMARMLTRGTAQRSREQIAAVIDDLGAEIDSYSGRNSFGLTARCLPEDFAAILPIVADCLQNPAFPAEEFQRVQQLTLAQIAAQQEDVDEVAEKLLRATLFQRHPYRFAEIGSAESVGQLSAEQLREFHGQVCRPAGTILVIQGAVEPEQVGKLLSQEFDSWAAGETVAPEIPVEPVLAERRTETVERGQNQALVYYGFLGPRVDEDERYVRDVMTAVLAGIGHPGGRLHTILRGEGLVYATYAYAIPGLDPGYYAIYAATAAAEMAQVQQIIEENVTRLQTELVGAEELARAKIVCLSHEQIGLAQPAVRAQSQALDELYGLGYDNYRRYQQRIEAVTAEQVRDYARKLLDLEACAVVVTRPQTNQ